MFGPIDRRSEGASLPAGVAPEIAAVLRELPPRAVRLPLGPLAAEEVQELLTAVSGAPADRELADQVRERRGGNPPESARSYGIRRAESARTTQ